MDYAKLSDDELDRMLAEEKTKLAPATKGTAQLVPETGGGISSDPYAGMTDAELDAAIASEAKKLGGTPVVQEMHPAFSAADRLVVKNFTNNNEAAVNYLQKRHPNLEVKVDDDSGQIQARARDGSEPEYRVLDPDTGFFSKDILSDVGDIGYDALAGVGTSAATAAAGLAGGAGTLGVGALPAAAAGGAAASGSLELLRQKLGNMFGVEQDTDWLQTGLATGAGAASPLLFGTGATAGQIAKTAATAGLDDAGRAALAASQRGAIGRTWDAAKSGLLPKIGEKASGVSADALRGLGKNYDELLRMETNPNAVTDLGKATGKNVGRTLREAKQVAWGEYQGALDSVGDELVDVSAAREALEGALAEADDLAAAAGTDASKSLSARLRTEFNKYFTKEVPTGEVDELGAAITQRVPLDALPTKAAAQLDRQLGELADLGKLGGASNVRGGVGARFGAGDSFEDKAVAQAAMSAKERLQAALDEVLPEGALAAKGRYGEIANIEKELKPLLKTPDKAFRTLRNLGRGPNRAKQELFNQVDQQFGTDLIPRAELAETFATFAKPGALPLSSGGVSGLARSAGLGALGAGAGYYLGKTQGEGSGLGGMMIGGALGGLLGGPAAMRQYVRAGLAGQRAGSAVQNAGRFFGPAQAAAYGLVTKPAAKSAWSLMNEEK